jgi:hypothetical protein
MKKNVLLFYMKHLAGWNNTTVENQKLDVLRNGYGYDNTED